MPGVDLAPFGFTRTESTVYGALLRLGTATGYAVAQATRIARANVYAALEGLAARRAAVRVPGRPARYRPTDPQSLIAHLAAEQGGALDALERALRDTDGEPGTAVALVAGPRPLANVVLRLVARAEHRVVGVVAAGIWRDTLPAWRRAGGRATLEIRTAGAVDDGAGLVAGTAPDDSGTTLLVDDGVAIVGIGNGEGATGLWGSHPALLAVVRRALGGSG